MMLSELFPNHVCFLFLLIYLFFILFFLFYFYFYFFIFLLKQNEKKNKQNKDIPDGKMAELLVPGLLKLDKELENASTSQNNLSKYIESVTELIQFTHEKLSEKKRFISYLFI
jgi:hypothetical protein